MHFPYESTLRTLIRSFGQRWFSLWRRLWHGRGQDGTQPALLLFRRVTGGIK